MTDKTKLGLKILLGAALLGILGDEVLRIFPWGMNFALWMSGIAMVALALAPFRKGILAGGGYWLLIAVVFFSCGMVWRDSLILKLLDCLALVIIFSLLMLRAQGRKLRDAGFFEYALGSAIAGLAATFSPFFLLINDINWKELRINRASMPAFAISRGILFSIPPVLIFGGLLVSADPVFEDIIKNTLHFSFTELIFHLFFAGFFAWIVSGFLRGMLLGNEAASAMAHKPSHHKAGIIETSIVLGLVDLLFLVFVFVQLRYFFGGSGLVQRTTGLTYADYARRGFFELVAVAALVLPLLSIAHWLLRKDSLPNERIFRALAGMQILLLFIIMASALQRMRLYQLEFGLTELRLYTTTFMGWLAVVFVWFSVTVLRGRRRHFAFGSLVAGYLIIVALHALNPDALIAWTNLARAREGHKLDAAYLRTLSADAVPELVQAFPELSSKELSPEERGRLSAGILRDWAENENSDWRVWSLGRARAASAVKENEPSLRKLLILRKNK